MLTESDIPTLPPLPTLFDTVRDAARVRTKAAYRPLGRFSRFLPANLTEPLPQNPWRILAETLPVNAAAVRPYKPVRFAQNAVVAARSPFRKGSIALDTDGVTLAGVAVRPVGWLGKVGGAGYFVWFICLMTNAFGQGGGGALPSAVGWLGGGGFVVGVLCGILEGVFTEMRRAPAAIRLAWSDVLEAQFERDSRWVVLIYRGAPKKEGKPGVVMHLPISDLTPAHAAAFWEALDVYAPGRTRADAALYDWTPRNILIVSLFLGLLIAGMTLLIVLNSRP